MIGWERIDEPDNDWATSREAAAHGPPSPLPLAGDAAIHVDDRQACFR